MPCIVVVSPESRTLQEVSSVVRKRSGGKLKQLLISTPFALERFFKELDRGELDHLCFDSLIFEQSDWKPSIANIPKFRRLSFFSKEDFRQVINHVDEINKEGARVLKLAQRAVQKASLMKVQTANRKVPTDS